MADILSVSSLNTYVKSVLESDSNLSNVAVEGEISNFKLYPTSGHCYFSLKDDKSVIKAVMFSSYVRGVDFQPENGMKVIVRGRVSLYERDGAYQLYVTHMFLSGDGRYRIAFEALKNKLEKEGLFDIAHKKPIPKYAFKIGVATSGSGAAFHDILSVAQRRFPGAQIVLAPCMVQGEGAEDTIVSAIKKLDRVEDIDVIIIGRGGGSKEDLWVFNSEKVARATFDCKKPTISAVGHEVDFSILDFVRDIRAATPTAAAEIALPDVYELNMRLANMEKSIIFSVNNKIEKLKNKLLLIEKSEGFSAVKYSCKNHNDKLITIQGQIKSALEKKIQLSLNRLYSKADLIESLSPINNLKKGYGLIYSGNKPVKDKTFTAGETLQLVTFSQELGCTVTDIKDRKS